MSDKWKGDGTSWKTQGLFLEHAHSDQKEKALYSIQPWDKEYKGKTYLSLHKLYVEMEDVAEWEFAQKYMGGYQHWLTLKASPFFKEPYATMVEELNAKVKGRSISVMMQQMRDGEASQATLKYLADNDFIKKNAVGKPKRKKPADKKAGSVVSLDLKRITS